MKKTTIRRALAAALALLFILALALPTLAAASSAQSSVYATAAVNVRSGPGTKYAKIGELKKGDAVIKLGTVSSWTLVEWNGGTAYISSSYLSEGASAGGAAGSYMYATTPVNVRSGPGTKYSIIGELRINEQVQKTGVSGNWTKVNYFGKTAYVSSAYLKPASVTPPVVTTKEKLYVLRDTAIYNGPSAANRAVGYMSAGDMIYYDGVTTGSWYKVQFGSYTDAYILRSDVIFYDASSSSTGWRVQAKALTEVYADRSMASSRIGYLYKGDTALQISTYSSGWVAIQYGTRTGYVRTSEVNFLDGTNTLGMSAVNAYRYAKYNNVMCYDRPAVSSVYRLGYLAINEAVYVQAANSEWSQCYIEGDVMYVLTDDLSKTQVSASSSGQSAYTFSPGKTVYTYYAYTYDSYTGDAPYKYGSESVAYGELERNTPVKILSTRLNGRVQISWREDRADKPRSVTHEAWVEFDDLRTTSIGK